MKKTEGQRKLQQRRESSKELRSKGGGRRIDIVDAKIQDTKRGQMNMRGRKQSDVEIKGCELGERGKRSGLKRLEIDVVGAEGI